MKIIQRKYSPGSEWVYFKIYTGNKTIEKILIKDIPVIINKINRIALMYKWFFIRYSDPESHLRIRFLVKNKQNIVQLIEIINNRFEKLIENNIIWKIQIDTYNRELERYGEQFIEDAESVFYVDSACILSILMRLNNNENYRWMIALKLADTLLSDFGLNMEEKQKFADNTGKAYKIEFGFNEFNAKQFNAKFRENKKAVESVLDNTLDNKEFISLVRSIQKRTKQMVPIVGHIQAKSTKDQIDELLRCFLHMTFIRLFRSHNRLHEMILYDFMSRYYTSEIMKKKYNKK